MHNNSTTYSLSGHLKSPTSGEDVLDSMLQWVREDDDWQGTLAGVMTLNWAADDGPNYIYDKVVGGRRRPLFNLTVNEATRLFDMMAGYGELPQIIYFAGEDPAAHPQVSQILEIAHRRGIPQLGLQCSGQHVARDDPLLKSLARLKPLLFVEFDGFDETVSLILHGRRDLPFETKRGLDRLAAAGLAAVLLVNVAQGINLQEVGAIAAFGRAHPAVFGAIFRPLEAGHMGLQSIPIRPVGATTIMEALEQQSSGLFRRDAFAPSSWYQAQRHFYTQVAYAQRNDSPFEHGSQATELRNGYCVAHSARSCFWLGVHEFVKPRSKTVGQARRCPLVLITPDGRTIPYCLDNGEGAS